MTTDAFSTRFAAADTALAASWWGVDRQGPSLAEFRRAAEVAGDPLLAEAVHALDELGIADLIQLQFVRHARNYLDVFYYPEPRKGPVVTDAAAATERLRWPAGAARDGVALYVDVPFCESVCAFCTTAGKNTHGDRAPVRAYLERLLREVRLFGGRFADGFPPIACLYIGGGTGSYLELDEIDDLLAGLRGELGLPSGIPMTLEGSPSTLDGDKAAGLLARGFSAISFGVESFEDHLLRDCRRAHDSALAKARVSDALAAGFGHVNIDLIFGLPHQTLADFARTMATVGELLPGAVTFYSLRLHRKTGFWQRGDENFPAILPVYLMQVLGRLYLARLGYERSENNRYVRRPEFAHAQNNFTRGGGFNLGLGTRAQSQIDGVSWRNSHITRDYLAALDSGHLPLTHLTEVSPAQTRFKHFLLPLKLRQGLNSATFRARCGLEVEDAFGPIIEELIHHGLLQRTDGGYGLTESGLLLETETLRWVEQTMRAQVSAGAGENAATT